ncbi:MAG: protocatechuate 3,4-dioxygenase [Blastocatellia bacterium]|nr:MAG: protocatechuate 3,4-dioxygenase [Blastocatellia bacterium]
MTPQINRRDFITQASSVLTLSIVGLGALDVISCTNGKSFATPAKTTVGTWRAQIAADNEPGERLVVSGRIFAPDGSTPMEGITLYVYQTDATGIYSATTPGDNRNTRLHGSMKTNSEGRYEFHTIKPGSYPGRKIPAHIHAYVSGPGYPEYWIDEYWFEGDPFITDADRRKVEAPQTFSPILKLTRSSDGVLHGVRDIKIERCSNNCTGR